MTEWLEKVLRPFLFVFFKILLKLPGHKKIMRPFARRFIGGETLDEAIEKGKKIAAQGFFLTFSYVGEDASSVSAIREAEETYFSLIDRISREKLPADIALKISQFNCRSVSDRYFSFLKRVVKRASHYKMKVWLDAEKLENREIAISLGDNLHKHYGNIGMALQAYAKDASAFLVKRVIPLVRAHDLPPALRICKGAYHEPKSLAFREPSKTKDHFRRMVVLISTVTKSFLQIATHETDLAKWSINAINSARDSGSGEIGMLLGVEEKTAQELVAQGKKVRIYLVFGKPWDAFVARRLIEKPRYLKYIFQQSPR